jgi:hypothetical protein
MELMILLRPRLLAAAMFSKQAAGRMANELALAGKFWETLDEKTIPDKAIWARMPTIL